MHRKLTISLVTWNGGKYLDQCLLSLENQTMRDFDLLILDNGSKDDSIDIIKDHLNAFDDRAKLIENSENLGFAKGHNQNIRSCDSEYVMVLNQDIFLDPKYLEECVQFLDDRSECGVVSGKILQWHVTQDTGSYQYKKTDLVDSLGHKIYKSQRVTELHVGERDDGRFANDMQVFGVSATVPVYRRTALETVRYNEEYFDPDFFSYKEDVDLAYRLRWMGWEAWMVADAVAYHDRSAKSTEGMTLVQNLEYRRQKSTLVNYNSYKNQFYVLIKNLSRKNFFRYCVHIKLDLLKRFFYTLFLEPKNLRALVEVARNLKAMRAKRGYIMKSRKVTDKEIARWFH